MERSTPTTTQNSYLDQTITDPAEWAPYQPNQSDYDLWSSTPPLSEQSSIESVAPAPTPVRQVAFTENADESTGRIGYLDHETMIEALKAAYPDVLTDWSQYKNSQFTLRKGDETLNIFNIFAESAANNEEGSVHLGRIADLEGHIIFAEQEAALDGFCIVEASNVEKPKSAESSSEDIKKEEKTEKKSEITTPTPSRARRAISALGSGIWLLVTAPSRLISAIGSGVWFVLTLPFHKKTPPAST